MYGYPPPWWGYPSPPSHGSPSLADIIAAKDFYKKLEDEWKEKSDKDKKKPKRGSYEWTLEKRFNAWHMVFWLIILSPVIAPFTKAYVMSAAELILK